MSITPPFSNVSEIAQAGKKKKSKSKKTEVNCKDDIYTFDILKKRYASFVSSNNECAEIILFGLPLRHQNPQEDITENIVKFIIRNYEQDESCVWAKLFHIKGDLINGENKRIEVKAFTSDGPSSFGPKKQFEVIYFLDMRKWKSDVLILWKVNLTYESPQWKNLKMNKTQTYEEQCKQGRRPHISWEEIHSQISDHCVKVFEGKFEDIMKPIENGI